MKAFKNFLIFATVISLNGCNLGAQNSISASSSNCNPITNSKQCTITLTYQAFTKGATVGVNYSQQYNQFSFSTGSCPIATQSSQTCVVPVSYMSNGSSVSENVTFTIGSATSGGVTLSGH